MLHFYRRDWCRSSSAPRHSRLCTSFSAILWPWSSRFLGVYCLRGDTPSPEVCSRRPWNTRFTAAGSLRLAWDNTSTTDASPLDDSRDLDDLETQTDPEAEDRAASFSDQPTLIPCSPTTVNTDRRLVVP